MSSRQRSVMVTAAAVIAGLTVGGWAAEAQAQGRPDVVWIAGGHLYTVHSVAYSPDGQMLASGSYDRTIKLWRVSDGQCLRTLTGHMSSVYSVAFSPDGQMLASGSRDETIKLWRVSDGALLKTYDEETGTGVLSVQYSPDGKLLAYGRHDATIVVACNPCAQQPLKGDLNCDGKVNFDDINPFVLALKDPVAYEKMYPGCPFENRDINGDGKFDFDDINPFVTLLRS